jgi:excisionase family DNA binding protein
MEEAKTAASTKDRKPRPPAKGVFLYKIEEAAYLLQLSVATVQRLVAKGTLSFRRVPGRSGARGAVRFAPADLEAFINGAGEVRGEIDNSASQIVRKARAKGLDIDPRVIESENRRRKGSRPKSD